MTSQTPGGRSIHLSYRELLESKAIIILGSYLTGVLHAAGISDDNVAMCGERNERIIIW